MGEQLFEALLCQQYVEMLVNFDEVERALLVLDNLPSVFRTNPPDNLKKLKVDILSSLCTTHAYVNSGLDCEVTEEKAIDVLQKTLRGILVEREIEQMEKRGVPHIVDMGPGEYFVPIGLKKKNHKFSYKDIGVDLNTKEATKNIERKEKPDKDQEVLFLALEVIEHLPSPKDVVIEALRHCGKWPEKIHLSTPCYTYDTSIKEWRKPCGLPHLRTYSPEEFLLEAKSFFPGYDWQLYPSQIMSLRGIRSDTLNKDDLIK